jgi:hypothetical protein
MTVTNSDKCTLGKGVNDQRQKNPPKVGLELIVKKTILAHVRLVNEQLFLAFVRFLGVTCDGEDPIRKKSQDCCKCKQRYSSENVRAPRITTLELVETVKCPGSVQNQDL